VETVTPEFFIIINNVVGIIDIKFTLLMTPRAGSIIQTPCASSARNRSS
jgi:hypothetical protein